MNDLAQRIRDRLDGLCPELPAPREHGLSVGGELAEPLPTAFIAWNKDDPLSAEQMGAWQKQWDELLGDWKLQSLRILPPGPRVYPGFEQMRDALLAVVGRHESVPVGTYLGDEPPLICVECSHGRYDEVPWPCPELLVIAEKLGIEVEHA